MKLYNSLTRKIEDFKPLNPPGVTYYACGPTVYDYAHIGNLRTFIFSDLLHRSLNYLGYNVNMVMNITDVGHLTSDADTGEDKIEISAKKQGKTAWQIADYYTKAFLKDVKLLNILPPTKYTKATDHIQEMISLVRVLEKNGLTYKTSDGIYFDTSKFPDYGKLATVDLSSLKKGARVEFSKEKRNSTDFALWKFSPKDKKRQMEWDSPWGRGFPGWHIECSAMSLKHLAGAYKDDQLNPKAVRYIDIHTGAVDHLDIHHTNEIAQSEGATNKPFVKYWLHGEFLLINKGRMGKSEGNFITLSDLIKKGYNPLSYRYFCLSAQYRTKLNFTYQALDNAQNALFGLYSFVSGIYDTKNDRLSLSQDKEKKIEEFQKKFTQALENDLNIPQALAVTWQVIKSNIPSEDKLDLIFDFDQVLGLDIKKNTQSKKIPDLVNDLVDKREKLRSEGKFDQADIIRTQIKDLGFVIEDSNKGTTIKAIFK